MEEGKHLAQKRLWEKMPTDKQWIVINTKLKKDEKNFLDSVARARRLRTASKKPDISKALLYLARIGASCLANHTDQYQAPRRLTPAAIAQSGLTITKNPNRLGRVKIISPTGIYSDDEDGC